MQDQNQLDRVRPWQHSHGFAKNSIWTIVPCGGKKYIQVSVCFVYAQSFKVANFSLRHLQALEDEMETASSESRSRSSTGLSSPLSLPMVKIEVTSTQPSGAQGLGEEPAQRLAGDRSFMLLDFPDVIKSAESSPRHSLIPLSEFYESQERTLNDRRTREIINQINVEVAQAVNRGQSPYYIYGIMDNDEETWC